MGISTTLLLVALAIAIVPAAALRFRPPRTIGQTIGAFTVGLITLRIAYVSVGQHHPFRLFEVMHLIYLLVVVTLPALLGIWFLSSVLRGERSTALTISGCIALTLAFVGVWGTHIEPNWLRTDRIAIEADVRVPLTIGVLADLQTPNVGGVEWRAVQALIEEKPDLVVVPGDLFQGPTGVIDQHRDDFVQLLTALVDKVEVVAVVSGDSDTTGQLAPMVDAAGALYMDNRIRDLVIANQPVRLAGVAVASSQAKRDTIAALGTPSDAVTVLISHRPGIGYALPPNTDIDLVVSGHTHGAQIKLPVISNHIWYSDVPPRIANGGLNYLNNFLLYVSTGVGLERHASPQVRFGMRPSIAAITLTPQHSPTE